MKTCPVCGVLFTSTIASKIYCEARCTNLAAARAYYERLRAGQPVVRFSETHRAGERFGALVVIGRVPSGLPMHQRWKVRCDCGREYESFDSAVRENRGQGCRECAPKSAAATAPGAERGRCSWCKRRAKSNAPFECGACQRTANRNGRDGDGRPIAKGKRFVFAAAEAS